MRAVLQRVSYASVKVNGEIVGKIDKGIVALIGINSTDDEEVYKYICDKIGEIKQIDPEIVAKITFENSMELFSLK